MKFKPPFSTNLDEKIEQLKFVIQNLEAVYGVPRNTCHDDPLDELISTILSQSTTNVNSDRAFAGLKKRFPNWELVRRARSTSIALAIKSGGLANLKSVVIKNILNEVLARRGNLDLSFLKIDPVDEAWRFLISLKGVGPKTAACVLLFSCQRQVFPMDTHIFRITRRLGIVPEKISDEQGHELMERLIPPEKHYSLHINLIVHGRKICLARNPKCGQCALIEQCEYGQSLI
ncbi:MAG: endonuclease III [Blastocatellia bacterium]